MSVSLVAVFIPILLMGGIIGRLFREFAVVLSVTILVSLAIVADGDPDDVLRACCATQAGPRQVVQGEREGVQVGPWSLRAKPEHGSSTTRSSSS